MKDGKNARPPVKHGGLTREQRFALLLIGPSVLGILLLFIYPMLYSFWVSLFKYSVLALGNVANFIGLGNYITALGDQAVRQTIGQTFIFGLCSTFLGVLAGLGISLLMYKDFPGKRICRSLLLVPWAVPQIVSVIVWAWIFDAEHGLFNYALNHLGLLATYKVWLSDPGWAMPIIIVARVWQNVPMITLIFMAGLETISAEMYEAAQIDGANAWKRFKYVTIPFMRPFLAVTLVIQTMWSFRTFDLIYGLTGGGPINRTMVLSMLTYKNVFEFLNFGYGSALAYFMLLIVLPFVLIYMKVFKFGHEE